MDGNSTCTRWDLFEPLVPTKENAFSPCFLTSWAAVFGWIFLVWNIYNGIRIARNQRHGNLAPKETGLTYIVRVTLVILHTTSWYIAAWKSHQLFLIPANLSVVAFLHIVEPFLSPVPHDSLLVFWPWLSIFQGFLFFQQFTSYKIVTINKFLLLNSCIIFFLEYKYWKPTHALIKHYHGDANLKRQLFTPNVIDKFTFCWMNPLIFNASNNDYLPQLPEYSPTQLSAEDSASIFLKKYIPNNSDWHFVVAVSKAFGKIALISFAYELVSKLLGFLQPQLLRLLILYFQEDSPILHGILICLLMFAVTLVQTFFYNEYFLTNLQLGLNCRSSLTSLIYQKSLRVNNAGTGDVINLMSVDVNRIQSVSQDLSTLILAPTDIAICIISLWPLLGKSTLSAIGTMCLLVPLNAVVVKYSKSLNKTQMKLKDKRSSLIQEILASIKSIKLFAWETPMLEKLSNVRNNEELKNLRKIRFVGQGAMLIWNIIPFLVSFTLFTTFALTSDIPLTSDIVFPALALLNLLSNPLLSLPQVITSMIEATVSLGRINNFLSKSELNPHLIKNIDDKKVEISGSYAWEDKPVLDNIHLTVNPQEFYCIVGKVGSGKSSLLSAILGNLKIIDDGSIAIGGTVAYCNQQPWIMNASVKENILFGHRWDPEYYQQTIEACQLTPDLNILNEGDATLVGEKGVSLSGGQKARLALARAVYARADVYLLDDVLSAVDSHVGKNLIQEVLLGLLKSKTVILCTNSISVLRYADKISLIENGQFVETVSSIDLESDKHPKLFALLEEFGNSSEESSSSCTPTPTTQHKLTRKASVETFTWEPLQKLLPNLNSLAEVSAKGKVKWAVYLEYFRATSFLGIFIWFVMLILASLLSVASNYWLKNWTEQNSQAGENLNVWEFILIYAAFGFTSVIVRAVSSSIMQLWLAIKASTVIHNQMAETVMHSPMSFFEGNPAGRIMNRFTNDISKIDSSISGVFSGFFSRIVSTIMTLGVVGYIMPPFILVIIVLSIVYVYYEISYVTASRELKRLVSISRSPIYAHLGESINGIETIKAFKQLARFNFINHANIDFNIQAVYMLRSINRWLYFRLQLIGSLGILSASTLSVLSRLTSHPLSSSMAGFVMTYAMQVTNSLRMVVRMSAEVEISVVALERSFEYCHLPTEKLSGIQPPLLWPVQGGIRFRNYSTRYRSDLPLVLNNINLAIKSGEKIGVVGRTGSGKSTLALSIFRILEASAGEIVIDDLVTKGVNLSTLRHKLSIIPQDSQLIAGTIRQNLDPFDYYSDDEIWRSLALAHLKTTVEELPERLEYEIKEAGSNFSQGQRQLMSLARVLLKMNDSKILVLDEATASVDVQTDKIIQQTIRNEFQNKTIITIAHRLDTVMDSDKILSLDNGVVQEFDTPTALLENKEGIFYSLCKQGGYI